MSADAVRQSRIPCLDGLRAVAALGVLFSHSRRSYNPSDFPLFDRFVACWPNSDLSVRIFFVISGFLITALLLRELDASNRIALASFYRRRVLRIFPAFYAYALGVAAVCWVTGTFLAPITTLSAVTFTTNYKHLWDHPQPNAANWLFGHTWTLALEEQYYLLWPLMLAFGKRKYAVILSAALLLLSPVLRILTYYGQPEMRPQIEMMLHTASDAVMIGSFMALIASDAVLQRHLTPLRRSPFPALAGLAIMACNNSILAPSSGVYKLAIGQALDNLAIAAVLYWLLNNASSRAGRILELPIMRYLGQRSYSLYLWQQFFFSALFVALPFRFPFSLLACLLMAELSYRFVEQPFRRSPQTANRNS